MIYIYNSATGDEIAEITETQLQHLGAELELDPMEEEEYSLDPELLSVMEEDGIDPDLVEALRDAMGEQGELEIRWSRL